MATGSVVYTFDVQLSDTSRGLYETLSVRPARHPSETVEYLLARVLAYCLEYSEGMELTKGLADPELPAVWARDLTGSLTRWIEVGIPSVEKLHKAAKAVPYVAVYSHKSPEPLLQQIERGKLHRAEEISLFPIDPRFLAELASITERRNGWGITAGDGGLYLSAAGRDLSCAIEARKLG